MAIAQIGSIRAASAAALLVFALSACVERKERLSISPAGGVLYDVIHSSESLNDLYEGDAVPRMAGGWLAEQDVTKNEEEKETFRLTARTVFGPGDELPGNFALRTDGDAEVYLQFPTELTIEERGDGTYYHVARVYGGRAWAEIEALRQQHVEYPLRDIKKVDDEDWTLDQRIAVLRALASFEIHKMLTFARAAFMDVTPEAAQDGWLAVRAELLDCVERLDYQSLAELIEPVGDSQEPERRMQEQERRKEMIEAETAKFKQMTVERMKEALGDLAGYTGLQKSSFMSRVDSLSRFHEITEDVSDDTFEIAVEMPGTIIGSNADGVSGRTATWTFTGEMLRDREIELLVSSRVLK